MQLDKFEKISIANGLPYKVEQYDEIERRLATASDSKVMRVLEWFGRHDLYALIRFILSTRNWKNGSDSFWARKWLLDRAREVQYLSEDTVDIWARGHCKTTFKSFALVILLMILDRNTTISMFAATKTIVDDFVDLVKQELESNILLHCLYPDTFWSAGECPASVRWTTEKGFTIKRDTKFASPTLRGFGIKESNFAGARALWQIFDDISTEKTISTPEQAEKSIQSLSSALKISFDRTKRTFQGTFYGAGDAYHYLAQTGAAPIRIHPCYELIEDQCRFDSHGLPIDLKFDDSKPVLFDPEYLKRERQLSTETNFATQYLCWPTAGTNQEFPPEFLRTWKGIDPKEFKRNTVRRILVDPAGGKPTSTSRSAVWVVGYTKYGAMIVIDGIIDHLQVQDRIEIIKDFCRDYWPIHDIAYEEYSIQSDVAYLESELARAGIPVMVTKTGGRGKKEFRISNMLGGPYRRGLIVFPDKLIKRLVSTGQRIDIMERFFREELFPFPNSSMMDGLDALARGFDEQYGIPWPSSEPQSSDSFVRRELWKTGDKDTESMYDWLRSG